MQKSRQIWNNLVEFTDGTHTMWLTLRSLYVQQHRGSLGCSVYCSIIANSDKYSKGQRKTAFAMNLRQLVLLASLRETQELYL
jgi:hypothetical protein